MTNLQPRGTSQCERRLHVEHLEGRRLLAVVTVDTELDVVNPTDGLTSLREAIVTTNSAPGPDEIVFDFGHDGPAVILLEQGELEITEALTITGDGPDLLTIDAQQQSRIFHITAETGDFTHEGMTLTGGKTTGDAVYPDTTFSGGAIRSLTTGTLTIQNSDVSNSSTTSYFTTGGGIFAEGDVMVTSSTISGNSGGGGYSSGGGISAKGAVTVTSSTISGNSATRGGGISAGGNVMVASSTISGNSAGDDDGGGILAGGEVTVTSSTISGNSAEGRGGGIYSAGDVIVTSSTISRNSTDENLPQTVELSGREGGGIYTHGNVTVTSSTISGNSADPVGGISSVGDVTVTSSTISGNSGGGILARHNVTVTFSTISGNSADFVGGGINASFGDVTVISSTVSGNSSKTNPGGGIFAGNNVTVTTSTISGNSATRGGGIWTRFESYTSVLSHSIVAGNLRATDDNPPVADDLAGNGSFELGYSLVGTAVGVINTTPGTINYFDVDPLLGPLADNGGPTKTHALLPGSLALDAGDPGVPFDPNMYDQRGAPFQRVASGIILGIPQTIIDIGAYEAQAPPSADFVDDDIINGADFLAWQRGFGKAHAVRTDGNSDDDSDVDHSDLAAWRATYGQTEGPPPPVNTVGSRQSAVSSAALIDAAMALEWLGGVVDDAEVLVFDTPNSSAAAVDSVLGQRDNDPLPVDDERVASVASSSETDNHDQLWLAEELLKRVFG